MMWIRGRSKGLRRCASWQRESEIREAKRRLWCGGDDESIRFAGFHVIAEMCLLFCFFDFDVLCVDGSDDFSFLELFEWK